jgi:hypothetical protein
MPQVGNVLRALIGDARNVVFVNQHDRGVMIVRRRQLLNVNYGSIRNSASDFKPRTAFTFNVFRGLGLSSQQRIRTKQDDAAGGHQSIKSKRIHTKKGRSKSAWAADSSIRICAKRCRWKWVCSY